MTVGLVDWSLDRPGLTSGFVPDKVADDLDFLCVHLYPEEGQGGRGHVKRWPASRSGKPVVIEETFPLKCSMAEFAQFIDESKKHACGWIGFYWGKPPEELRRSRGYRTRSTWPGWSSFKATCFLKKSTSLGDTSPKA